MTQHLSDAAYRALRQEFWEFYVGHYPSDLELRTGYCGNNAFLPTESVRVVIGLWLAPSDQSIGVYIRGPNGEMAPRIVHPRLRPYEGRFKDEIDIDLIPNSVID